MIFDIVKFKFKAGVVVRDKITGFTGTITGRADYVTGCKQYAVTPKAKADGEQPCGHWLDEGRLELVKENKPAIKKRPTGGPQYSPSKT